MVFASIYSATADIEMQRSGIEMAARSLFVYSSYYYEGKGEMVEFVRHGNRNEQYSLNTYVLRINIVVEQKKREQEKYTLQWFLLDFHANK